ncbi:unnamed protein product [Leuciscus chuanchicus]
MTSLMSLPPAISHLRQESRSFCAITKGLHRQGGSGLVVAVRPPAPLRRAEKSAALTSLRVPTHRPQWTSRIGPGKPLDHPGVPSCLEAREWAGLGQVEWPEPPGQSSSGTVFLLGLDEGSEPSLLVVPHAQQCFMVFLVKTREQMDDVHKRRWRRKLHDGSSDLLPSWVSAPMATEFTRITTLPLIQTFMSKLDGYANTLAKVFKEKGGAAGRKISNDLEKAKRDMANTVTGISLSELKVNDLNNHHWMLGSLMKE